MAKLSKDAHYVDYYRGALVDLLQFDDLQPWMTQAYVYRGSPFVDYRHLWEGMPAEEVLDIAKSKGVPTDQRLEFRDEDGELRLFIPAGFVAESFEAQGETEPATIYGLIAVSIMTAHAEQVRQKAKDN